MPHDCRRPNQKSAYFDSVTLMRVGKEIAGLAGVADAAIVMGTKANKAILNSSGLLVPEFAAAGDTDLLIAANAKDRKAADTALAAADGLLRKGGRSSSSAAASDGGDAVPPTLAGVLNVLPDANLALISVAGPYAGEEARRALECGLHVMLFSNNAPLETEIVLKKFARRRGLLVMGPNCGTAIINGVPLALANVVTRGSIGIVAAAGIGLRR
jgi:FdrA protein